MPSRRRSCVRGAAATASTAARCSAPGCTGSRRTSASTCSGAVARRLTAMHSFAEVPWLQPYPDRLLDEVAPSDERAGGGRGRAARRSSSRSWPRMQVLPPRQRAALIARDVLGWPAIETASLLETSVPAANSALQRARATMQAHLPARRSEWSAGEPSDEERALLAQFIDAHERGDAAAGHLDRGHGHPDHHAAIPPTCSKGSRRSSRCSSGRWAMNRDGDWRLVPTMRQPDADGRKLPSPTGRHEVPGVQVRRAARSRRAAIAEITTFGPALFPAFGLPLTL